MDQHFASLDSFGQGFQAAVIGASGGIGGAMCDLLLASPQTGHVHGLARTSVARDNPRFTSGHIDLEDEASIAAAAARIQGPVHLVVIATGLLHNGPMQPEKALRELDGANAARAFAVNAIGPALVAKHFLPLMPRDEKCAIAALSARVGSISDNQIGGWHSYRASKAALNMFLKNIAIEAGRRHRGLVVCGLQPGTVDTGLSKPFQSAVKEGKLFSPAFSAARLLEVVNGLGPDASGQLFDWSGRAFAP